MSKPRKRHWGSGVIAVALLAASMGAMAADTSGIEKRMKMLEQELQSLRSELEAIKSSEPAQTQHVQQLETRVNAVETTAKETTEPVQKLDERVKYIEEMGSPYFKKHPAALTGNMIFFRGGYASLLEDRAFGSFTDTHNISGALAGLGVPGVSSAPNDDDKGWFVGAGFDFLLTQDVWGLMPGTWALAELGVEYKNFGSERTTTVVPLAECLLGSTVTGAPGAVACAQSAVGDVELTMLTVSASPKVKFMEGSKLRPWIIPVGLDINVISPPSDSATVLDVGAQFAAGVDYEIIPGIKIGIDGRYHLTGDFTESNNDLTAAQRAAFNSAGLTIDTDQSNNFWSVGGYLGIGF